MMLSGCQATPEPLPTNVQPTKVVYQAVKVPDQWLILNQVFVEPTTWGESLDALLEAYGALGQCNSDKLKIQEWNHVQHTEERP